MTTSVTQVQSAIRYVKSLGDEVERKIVSGSYIDPGLPTENQLLEYRVGIMSLTYCRRVEKKLREILGSELEDGDDGLEPMIEAGSGDQ